MLRLCQAQVQLKLSLVKILKLRQSLICQNKLSQVVRGWGGVGWGGGWFEQGGIFFLDSCEPRFRRQYFLWSIEDKRPILPLKHLLI